ncbi:MAG: asparagine synthase (glutamine-hydrolyzing) [Flavobacteriales bacterium]|nr:asparagine synthase (glutamine-hydrolyzing) [Flavobacteriales bacterium]
MCGIFGVWNYQGVNGHTLRKVSTILRHRGPDDEGFLLINDGVASEYSGEDTSVKNLEPLPESIPAPFSILHRRLSILDLSAAGHQPMRLPNRGIYISFNGEIYNYEELRDQHDLETFTGTDTEVVLLLYAKLGEEAFSMFRGMWAMSILDLEKGKLILSRDRFGIKPLYYTDKFASLAFSSEIKPLLALPRIKPQWEREKLVQFLVYGVTSDPCETFFSGISAVKPGCYLTFDLETLRKEEHVFYDLRSRADEAEFAEDSFELRFEGSIKEHLISDLEVGSCLSGGLDSSTIVATAYPFVKQSFTCSFPNSPIDETGFAKQLTSARSDLQQHFTSPSSQDYFEAFDEIIRSQERPIGSASVFAQYSVMKLAKENGVTVLLDGQGADEVFGGYYPFAGAYLLSLLKSGNFSRFTKEMKLLKQNFNPKMEMAMMRSLFYSLPKGMRLLARKKNRLGFDLLSRHYKKIARGLSVPERGSSDFKELAIKSVGFGLLELLHYEDRNSMRFSIESRVPFLDHRLVEWALSQSPETLLNKGWTKNPIRELLDKKGLKDLAWRKDKLGFVVPQKAWRDELFPELKEKWKNLELDEVFDQQAMLDLLENPVSSSSAQSEFWRVYGLLRWLELFKVELI